MSLFPIGRDIVTNLRVLDFFGEDKVQFKEEQVTISPFSDKRLWIPDLRATMPKHTWSIRIEHI